MNHGADNLIFTNNSLYLEHLPQGFSKRKLCGKVYVNNENVGEVFELEDIDKQLTFGLYDLSMNPIWQTSYLIESNFIGSQCRINNGEVSHLVDFEPSGFYDSNIEKVHLANQSKVNENYSYLIINKKDRNSFFSLREKYYEVWNRTKVATIYTKTEKKNQCCLQWEDRNYGESVIYGALSAFVLIGINIRYEWIPSSSSGNF